jgi:hypothetical protein
MFGGLSLPLQNSIPRKSCLFCLSFLWVNILGSLSIQNVVADPHMSELLSPNLKTSTELPHVCSGSVSFFFFVQNQYLDFYFYSNMATAPQCIRPALSSSQNRARAVSCLLWFSFSVPVQNLTSVTKYLWGDCVWSVLSQVQNH